MCAYPYLKFSDLLPETHLFFIWPEQSFEVCVIQLVDIRLGIEGLQV